MMLRLSLIKKYILKFLQQYALPLIYPRHCPFCGIIVPYSRRICPECIKKLPLIHNPTCYRCGKPLNEQRQELCYDCRIFPKSFDQGSALFIYNSMTRRAISAFKYHNQRYLSDFFVHAIYRMHFQQLKSWNIQAIIPVPVHKNKRKRRGYNQTDLLAKELAELMNLPYYTNFLIRVNDTPPQKTFNPQARLNNLYHAFSINSKYTNKQSNMIRLLDSVLLIDDIYTTGSTMESCTRLLKSAGIKHVYIYSLCIGVARDEII